MSDVKASIWQRAKTAVRGLYQSPQAQAYAWTRDAIARAAATGATTFKLIDDETEDHPSLIAQHLQEIPPSITSLTGLTHLNLAHTEISDLTPIAGMTGLQSLELYRTAVSDIAPLSGMTNLQTLSLNYAPVSDLSPVAGMTALADAEHQRHAGRGPVAHRGDDLPAKHRPFEHADSRFCAPGRQDRGAALEPDGCPDFRPFAD